MKKREEICTYSISVYEEEESERSRNDINDLFSVYCQPAESGQLLALWREDASRVSVQLVEEIYHSRMTEEKARKLRIQTLRYLWLIRRIIGSADRPGQWYSAAACNRRGYSGVSWLAE